MTTTMTDNELAAILAGDHYCNIEELQLMPSPLNDCSEPGIDPFEAYGVFRCNECGDWWVNWLRRAACSEQVDWLRIGTLPPNERHHALTGDGDEAT